MTDHWREKRQWVLPAVLAVWACCQLVEAQRADVLGAEARKYLRVAAARVVLEHVSIIDGAGAAAIAVGTSPSKAAESPRFQRAPIRRRAMER